MFSDRPIGFYEASNAPRSKTYVFGMLVLNLNDKGEGDGLSYGACTVKANNGKKSSTTGGAPARLAAVKLWK